MVERNDSSINLSGATAHSTIDVPSHPPLTASSAAACPSVALAFEDSGSRSSGDEVTIVVGRRKNSTTKAVRYLTTFMPVNQLKVNLGVDLIKLCFSLFSVFRC